MTNWIAVKEPLCTCTLVKFARFSQLSKLWSMLPINLKFNVNLLFSSVSASACALIYYKMSDVLLVGHPSVICTATCKSTIEHFFQTKDFPPVPSSSAHGGTNIGDLNFSVLVPTTKQVPVKPIAIQLSTDNPDVKNLDYP